MFSRYSNAWKIISWEQPNTMAPEASGEWRRRGFDGTFSIALPMQRIRWEFRRLPISIPATVTALGIPVVVDSNGVGRNLQDHLQQRAIFKVSGIKTLNETYHSLFGRVLMGAEYALFRTGPLTMAPSQLGIFTRSDPGQHRVNLQFHVQPLSLDRFGEPLHRFPAVTVSACNLRPTSRGTVRLRSTDCHDKPVICPKYLSTDADRQVAADAIRVTRRLMRQQALEAVKPQEFLPGVAVSDSLEDLAKAAGDIGTTIFHPVGTAKMGPSRAVDLSWKTRSSKSPITRGLTERHVRDRRRVQTRPHIRESGRRTSVGRSAPTTRGIAKKGCNAGVCAHPIRDRRISRGGPLVPLSFLVSDPARSVGVAALLR
jgi:hypothetical protein